MNNKQNTRPCKVCTQQCLQIQINAFFQYGVHQAHSSVLDKSDVGSMPQSNYRISHRSHYSIPRTLQITLSRILNGPVCIQIILFFTHYTIMQFWVKTPALLLFLLLPRYHFSRRTIAKTPECNQFTTQMNSLLKFLLYPLLAVIPSAAGRMCLFHSFKCFQNLRKEE